MRRSFISIFELITFKYAIVIAVAVVQPPDGGEPCGHAIVWDGWRALLFVGPGNRDDRGIDGTIRVETADQVKHSSQLD